MNISEKQFEKLKTKIEDDYSKNLANLNEDRKKKLEALELIASLGKNEKSSNPTQEIPVERKKAKRRTKKLKPSASSKKLSVSKLIKDVIESMTTDFDKNLIGKIVKEKNPDIKLTKDSVRIVTSGMEKEGKLVKVTPGKGKRPTLYRRKIDSPENAQTDPIE